jgi:hypothetical protein
MKDNRCFDLGLVKSKVFASRSIGRRKPTIEFAEEPFVHAGSHTVQKVMFIHEKISLQRMMV